LIYNKAVLRFWLTRKNSSAAGTAGAILFELSGVYKLLFQAQPMQLLCGHTGIPGGGPFILAYNFEAKPGHKRANGLDI
jgi:hypothetical protein